MMSGITENKIPDVKNSKWQSIWAQVRFWWYYEFWEKWIW